MKRGLLNAATIVSIDLFDSFHVGLGSQAFSGSSVGLFCLGYYAVHWWCQQRNWTTKVRSVKSS